MNTTRGFVHISNVMTISYSEYRRLFPEQAAEYVEIDELCSNGRGQMFEQLTKPVEHSELLYMRMMHDTLLCREATTLEVTKMTGTLT